MSYYLDPQDLTKLKQAIQAIDYNYNVDALFKETIIPFLEELTDQIHSDSYDEGYNNGREDGWQDGYAVGAY